MARSFHQTIKKVFGGKSKQEISEMIASKDDDVRLLGKKLATKRKTRATRAAKKAKRNG